MTPGDDGTRARGPFPWARPRRELVLLLLVALATLSPIRAVGAGTPHTCLAEALLHGHLSADACLEGSFDRSVYGGHLYSDKAPGLAIVQVPSVALLQPNHHDGWSRTVRLWAVSILSVGIALLLGAFLVGRVSEGLAPGYGGIALVFYSLGTLVAPLATVSFGHVPAATLAFGSFLFAWRRRPGWAGILAGASILATYESGLAVVIIGGYVALQGWRPLTRFLLGTAPAAALLGAYDWAAFGVPWHLSYSYIGNVLAQEQAQGFFGIGLPHVFGAVRVMAGSGGLLVISPVLVMAAFGLVVLGREHRSEAVVAGAISVAFVLMNSSYFLPYGGDSPGPRFLVVALPFLAVGLGPALATHPRTTLVLGALSVCAATALSLVWAGGAPLRGGVWDELARVLSEGGSSRFAESLASNALSFFGPGRYLGALVVAGAAGAAVAVAFVGRPRTIPSPEKARAPARRSFGLVLLGVAALSLIVAANLMALTNYPYGVDPESLVKIHTSISAVPAVAHVGEQTTVSVSVENGPLVGVDGLTLTIALSPGLHLVQEPKFTRGSGCTGARTIVCDLDSLSPGASTSVVLVIETTDAGEHEVTAVASLAGDGVESDHESNHASLVLPVES